MHQTFLEIKFIFRGFAKTVPQIDLSDAHYKKHREQKRNRSGGEKAKVKVRGGGKISVHQLS